jgi:hypothetical protein
MSRPIRTRAGFRAALLSVLVATALAGCGNDGASESRADRSSSPVAQNAADGDWLLRFTTAEGADGEQARSVYVRYNPTTGEASARSLPALIASDASQDEQVLLVSADHTRAVQDTSIPKAERQSGKLTIYSVADDTTETLDIRAITGQPDLRALAWAFDPVDPNVLRVVDAARGVWKVDLAAHSATKEATLPAREGWIFGNGFDKNSGEPYIESIDSDQTEPAGNGDSDTRAVERQGGTLIRYDGAALADLPEPPCGFAGGFRFTGGEAWLFCADTPSIATYRFDKAGNAWKAYGMPSPKVVPAVAAELTFALPPVR